MGPIRQNYSSRTPLRGAGPREAFYFREMKRQERDSVYIVSRMNLRLSTSTLVLAGFLSAMPLWCQSKQQAVINVDLKPLGAAPDLFTDQSDSKYSQRGVIGVFWVNRDRVAVAFSTTRRWSDKEERQPLQIRLIIFDPSGKQLNQRDWNFGGEGPAGDSTLDLAPGPENTILAIHDSATPPAPGAIPEGNFIQVLKPDTSLEQNFYVPATSVAITGIAVGPGLPIQTFYADKHSSLTWWSGNPLQPGPKLDIPHASGQILVGPATAARPVCADPNACTAIRVFRPGQPDWFFRNTNADLVPSGLVFLDGNSLLVDLLHLDGKGERMLLAHPDGTQTPLPDLPKAQTRLTITGVSANARRFSIDASTDASTCKPINFFCKQVAKAYVIDTAANKIVLEENLSLNGAQSALSPDGTQLAIFDKDKLAIYPVP
ncbi:hypothetical protein ACPOL_4454 [Acidisarcina polymorpha]|uniref:Uncharacterized protein n=2 Tax=Acidisarcina polymorpha TaxID=2211140 RepID=A0A2Z5G5A2_9BACT|nr:hypothetical protein ACPOL_4454 [Acidisarcina polymorpha]